MKFALILAMGSMTAAACVTKKKNSDDDEEQGEGGAGASGGNSAPGPGPGPGGQGGTGGGTNTCELTVLELQDPNCAACAEGACCTEMQACEASQDCLDFPTCFQQCQGDETCIETCETTHASGVVTLDAVDACLESSCPNECGGPESFPICDSGFALGDEACATCLSNSCCTEAADCFDEDNCNDCAQAINAPTSCDASTLDEPLRDCWTNSCATECGDVGF